MYFHVPETEGNEAFWLNGCRWDPLAKAWYSRFGNYKLPSRYEPLTEMTADDHANMVDYQKNNPTWKKDLITRLRRLYHD